MMVDNLIFSCSGVSGCKNTLKVYYPLRCFVSVIALVEYRTRRNLVWNTHIGKYNDTIRTHMYMYVIFTSALGLYVIYIYGVATITAS